MNAVKRTAPGYILLKPYELKRKSGAWQVASEEGDNAPELGEVLAVGPEIRRMPFKAEYLPKVGDIIAYKRYNHFKFELGSEPLFVVHFENILFELEPTSE